MSCSQMEMDLFHDHIKCGDCDKVELMIDKYPQEKYFCNSSNESAVKTAIEWRRYDIYELLLSRGIWLSLGEDITTFSIDDQSKIKIKHINRKFFKDPNAEHLMRLFSMSRLSHYSSDIERPEHNIMIIKAFEDLNKLKWIEPILKVAATSKDLKIVFDFDSDSVECLDPKKSKTVEGITYPRDQFVYVGAKGLRNDATWNEVLGTLIHELCHFAMEMIYNSNCKPYFDSDTKRQREFSEIVRKCELEKAAEDLVAIVYNPVYSDDVQHAELIVRVPHLIAFYNSNEEKYLEVSEKFQELFDYYAKYVLADLKSQHPKLEARGRIAELNEQCLKLDSIIRSEVSMTATAPTVKLDASNKVLHLASNCPQVSMKAIYQQLSSHVAFNSYIFIDLKALENRKIFDCVAGAFNLCTQPTIVVDCDQSDQKSLNEIVKGLNDKGLTQRIIFVTDNKLIVPSVSSNAVTHLWNHFSNDFQKLLLLREISFQGINIQLKDIIDNLPEVAIATQLNSFDTAGSSSIPLNSLVKRQRIEIGNENIIEDKILKVMNAMPFNKLVKRQKKIEIGTEIKFDRPVNFVERSFLNENSEHNSYSHSWDPFGWVEDFKNVLEIDGLVEKSKNEQDFFGILLYDKPGMGKSTVFKFLTKELKEKLPQKWILFMDLKLYSSSYQKDKDVSANFSNSDEISDFFCSNVINAGSVESQVFKYLFDKNRVIILMDGFDEICPSYKKFALKLISGIKAGTKNQVWISTRPHLMAELESFKLTKLQLKPFDEQDCTSFFEKFLKNKNVGQETSAKLLLEIETFLKTTRLNALYASYASPLVMKLISEVIEEDSYVLSSNLFSLYEQFEKKMYKKCMSKGSEAEKDLAKALSNQELSNYFFGLSLRVVIDDDDDEIFKVFFQEMPQLPIYEIVRTGIVESDSSNNLQFIHRSFAEFFVAKFMFSKIKTKNISDSKLEDIVTLFSKVLKLTHIFGSMVPVFLDHAFESVKNDDYEICINNFKKFPSDLKNPSHYFSMTNLIENGCLNLIKMISRHLISDPYSFWRNDFIDLTPLAKQNQQFFDGFWPLAEEFLRSDNLAKLLLQRNDFSRLILQNALLASNLEIFNSIVEKAERILIRADFEYFLIGGDHRNYLFYALEFELSFEKVFSIHKQKLSTVQIKEMLKSRDNTSTRGSLLLNATKEEKSSANLKCLCDTLSEYLADTNELRLFILDSYGGELGLAAKYGNAAYFDILWTFISQIFKGNTLLQFLETEETDLSVFHHAARSKKKDTFKFVLQLYKDKFNNEKIKEMILANVKGESILSYLIRVEDSSEANLIALWEYIQDLFEIEEIKMLLNRTSHCNETLFEIAAEVNRSFLGILMKFVNEHYSEHESFGIRTKIESISSYESRITEQEDE